MIMAQSGAGHVSNVANFESLIDLCTVFGTMYNPGSNHIQLPTLQTKATEALAVLQATRLAKVNYDDATNAREITFESLKKLSTRIVNALKATTASEQKIDDAKTIARKIQGSRKKNTPPEVPVAGEVVPRKNSVTQQGYGDLLENFTKLVGVISTEPLYLPNEEALQLTSLNALIIDLKASSTVVTNMEHNYSTARIQRDEVLYAPNNGMVDLALAAKVYVKSCFGASSPQYKQLGGLEFRRLIS
jgi:hypothetical protein